jgi:hypothetical protein
MASTVSLTQSPSTYNLAYGPNPVTLSSLPSGAQKYILKVTTLGGTVLADIRQTGNQSGTAIFDIQNILQTYVHVSPINTEQIGLGNQSPANLQNSEQEVEQYVLRIGHETDGQENMRSTSYGPYNVIGGKKPWYDIVWAEGPYQGAIQGDDSNPPCTNVYSNGQPLSDNTTFIRGSELTTMGVAAPSSIGINTRVQIHDVFQDDLHTVSYFNPLYTGGLPSADALAQGIEGFRITSYELDGSLVDDVIIPNTVSNGGGPNVNYGDGTLPSNNTAVITAGLGPLNLQNFNINYGAFTTNYTLDSAVAYYYVQTVAYTPGTCLATFTGYADESLHWVQMFRIYGRGATFNQSGCLDYERIQFSWLNSYGFRDYYTFTKKNVRSTKRRANNFLANTADYNATTYETTTGARGFTTYSQEIQETFSASTGYMSDEEAKYLEGLFNSPDVRVRLGLNGPAAYEAYFFGCNVTSASWTEKTYRKDKLFQYDIKFKLANNVKSQRG